MNSINSVLTLISGLWDKVVNASKALYLIFITYTVSKQAQELKEAKNKSEALNNALEVEKKYEEINSKSFGGRDATLKRMYDAVDDNNTTNNSK